MITISPEEGVLQSQSDFYFEVAFHPKKTQDNVELTGIEL
jgi:hypothetical protein